MHRIISSIPVALALAATAHAATPEADTREPAEAAVLECHAQYAQRYANRVEAAPSELAAGAFAACKSQMDAFVALAPELAKEDEQVAIGIGDKRAVERGIVDGFRKEVRNATIDAVIRARAAP